METIYLRSQITGQWWQTTLSYYKVVETAEGCTSLQIDGLDLSIREQENYHEEVVFIQTKLCNGDFEVITRKEFDEHYKTYVSKLNALASA